MPKTVILPPGTGTPIAPFSPGTLADWVVYVSGTLAFDKDNNVAHVGDAAGLGKPTEEESRWTAQAAGLFNWSGGWAKGTQVSGPVLVGSL